MKYISFLFFIYSSLLFSQRIKSNDVIRISDSILKIEVGDNLFENFTISEGSYCKYQKKKNYTPTGKFLSKKATSKKVTQFWVLYHFQHDKLYESRNGVWIKLDKNLNLIEPITIDFIPDFLRENKESNFIDKNKAREIGEKSFTEIGYKIEDPVLKFDEKRKRYVFQIFNKITKAKNVIGQDSGEMEIVDIDAESGKVLSNQKGYYGIYIR